MPEPFNPEQPSLTRSLLRSNAEIEGLGSIGYGASTLNALQQMNIARVERGARPYTLEGEGTRRALLAAQQGTPVTEEKEKGSGVSDLFGNFRSNVSDLGKVMSPTTLIRGIGHQIAALPELPSTLGRVALESDNPLEFVGNMAGEPGVELVPGSFVLNQLLGDAKDDGRGQGVKGLMQNPLWTTLDVSPYAGTAARASKLGKAIKTSRQTAYDTAIATQIERVGPDIAKVLQPPLPKKVGVASLVKYNLDDAGEAVLSKTGERMARGNERFKSTNFGNKWNAIRGSGERDMAQVLTAYEEGIQPGGSLGVTDLDLPEHIRDAASELMTYAHANGIEGTRLQEVFKYVGEGDPNVTPAHFNDAELAMIDKYREGEHALTEWNLDKDFDGQGITMMPWGQSGDLEVVTFKQAKVARELKQKHEVQSRLGAINDDVLRGELTPEQVLELRRGLTDEMLAAVPGNTRRAIEFADESYLYWMKARGYDVDAAIKNLDVAHSGKKRIAPNLDELPPKLVGAEADMTTRLRELIGRDRKGLHPAEKGFIGAYNAGEWKLARDYVRKMPQTELTRLVAAQLKSRIQVAKFRKSMGVDHPNPGQRYKRAQGMTTEHANKTLDQIRVHQERNAPTRWRYLANKHARQERKRQITELFSSDKETMLKHLQDTDEGIAKAIPGIDDKAILRDANRMWETLREAGFDPIYVHYVSNRAARRINMPRINVKKTAIPTQLAQSALDFTPSHTNLAVSLQHQAMEILTFHGRQKVVEYIEKQGISRDAVIESVMPRAQIIKAAEPHQSLNDIVSELASRRYQGWSEHASAQPIKVTNPNAPELWIDSSLALLLEYYDKTPLSGLERVVEPATAVFRTSVLALSPRWHLNNILGGYMLLTVQTGDPFAAFKYWGQARDALKSNDPGVPSRALGWGQGVGSMAAADTVRTAEAFVKKAEIGAQNSWMYKSRLGRTVGRIWEQVEKVSQSSFKFNQQFDDMYRTIAYMYDYDKAIKKGLSKADAMARGVALTRKTMQQWDRMTPIERTLMRTIMPFYGWVSHVMKFVYQYPIDHPFRTSVLANFADAEVRDWDSGLPQRFMSLFGLGIMNDSGASQFLDPGGANPFRDLDQYFTIQGMSGQMHPILMTLMQSMGIDTMGGVAELYPELEYNPESGRLEAKKQGWAETFGSAVYAIVPQTHAIRHPEGLAAMIGLGDGFEELNSRNPDSARRMMMSSLGLPTLWKWVHLPEEQMKAEMNRYEQMKAERNAAMKSGNWGSATLWAENEAYFDQVEALSPRQLEPFLLDQP